MEDFTRARATRSSSCRRSSTSTSPERAARAVRRASAPDAPTCRPPTGSRWRPPGAEKSDNPWHLREYTADEYRALLEPRFARVEMLGALPRRQAARCTSSRCALGWDRVHPRCGSRSRFYDRFVPAIAASDFALRPSERDLDRALDFLAVCHAREPRRPSVGRPGDRPAHPHALRRGLRHLSVRRGVAVRRGRPLLPAGARGRRAASTLTVTPGARRPARGARRRRAAVERSCARYRLERRARRTPRTSTRAARRVPRRGDALRAARSSGSTALDGDLLARSRSRPRAGGSRSWPRRPPTRCCRCSRPARAGGCRSTPGCARTGAGSAAARGFWLPECAYRAGARAAPGRARPRLLLHRSERPRGSARRRWPRSRREAGLVAFTIDWEAVQLALVARRLPVGPRLRRLPPQVAATGCRLVGDRRRAVRRRGRGRARPRAQAREFARRGRGAPRRLSPRERGGRGLVDVRDRHRAARPLVVRRGRAGSRRCSPAAPSRGVRAGHAAARRSRARSRRGAPAARLDLGRGQGPAHLGLAAGRRPGLGGAPARAAACCARSARRPRAPRGRERAARELLARAGERLGVPRRPPAGGRLPVPARDRPRARRCSRPSRLGRATRGCGTWRPTSAWRRCSSPEPPGHPRPLPPEPIDSRRRVPSILILSWEYPPLIEGGLARHVRKLSEGLVELGRRGPRAHPRGRGVAARGGGRRASASTASASRPARRTWASSSPGSSG